MATSFSSLVKRFARDERGASLVEYAVLVGLVTAATIVVITTLGTNINTAFTNIANRLNTANTQ